MAGVLVQQQQQQQRSSASTGLLSPLLGVWWSLAR
jgi:hypothetical protein